MDVRAERYRKKGGVFYPPRLDGYGRKRRTGESTEYSKRDSIPQKGRKKKSEAREAFRMDKVWRDSAKK